MGKRPLRRIGDPVIAAAPAGVRVRTRIHVSEDEAQTMAAIGEYLGSVYRSELAGRVQLGRLDRKQHGVWRAERKQAITAVSSSRWAGAITRAVEDQYQLGMRGLSAQVADLRSAIEVLEARCALRPGAVSVPAPDAAGGPQRRSRRPKRGYRDAAQRFSKTRRLAVLRQRLAGAEAALAAGRPSITVGGKRLWRNRQHLDQAQITEARWRTCWDASRMFLTADGESGKAGGNETIRVDQDGRLRVKVPAALAVRFGNHIAIVAPVEFRHRVDEWAERVRDRRAVRYDITFDADRDRWYLDACWTITLAPVPDLDELRGGRILSVDLNADHLACCVLDTSGNPVGEPVTIGVDSAGLRAAQRDGRVRAAITTLLDLGTQHNCQAIVTENLDFADARATGRETLGAGRRGKRLRRTVTGIPTRKFRVRLCGMAFRRGISVIGVDPAYTSKWGAQHWRKPLQQQTSDPDAVTVHHGAAAAIGRRGLGMAIRRRPAGPRTRDSGRVRALHRPDLTTGRGHTVMRTVPAHRHAHHDDEACRSARQHPSPAANTVRAAQDSLLITN